MKSFWRWLLTLPGVVLPAATPYANDVPDRARMIQLTTSVVKVQAFDERDRTFFGTGVVLAAGRVATNCHVTRHGGQIVIAYRGHSHHVTGQHADIEHDLCILSVPTLPVAALPYLPSTALRVGQPVWAMSFEGGAGIQLRTGMIRALHSYDQARIIESSTAFTSGASGGALMNSAGQLVGLLTYRLRGDRQSYYAIPLDWVPADVASADLPAVAPVRDGVAFWQREADALPFFLRAHRHVLEHDWPALLRLSEGWVQAHPGEVEAWWTRGTAHEYMARAVAAADAYRHALGLDPTYVPALLRLGRLATHLGDETEARRIMSTLQGIDARLAVCLAVAPSAPSPSESHSPHCNEIP